MNFNIFALFSNVSCLIINYVLCIKINFCHELKIFISILETRCIQINYTLYIENLYILPLSNSEEGYIKINYYCELKIFVFLFWGKLYKNQLCIIYKGFMHSSFKERYIKINYYCELKIFIPDLLGEVYCDQLYISMYRKFTYLSQKLIIIMNWKFLYLTSKTKYIKINYYLNCNLSIHPFRRGIFK